jgi:hypothetical protein
MTPMKLSSRYCCCLLAPLLCLLFIGCDNRPKTFEVSRSKRSWEQKESIEFAYDFGVLRPNQKATHRFSIPNTSAFTWNLAGMQHTCNCTASRPLSQSVCPGETMDIDVEYTAPGFTKNDARQVGVEFAEDNVPYYWLKIRATVHEPIAASPAALFVETHVVGPVSRENLTISNYMEHNVRQPEILCSAPWLTADLQPAAVIQEQFPARQAWQARVSIDTAKLERGVHQAQIEIRTDDPEVPRKVIPVELTFERQLEIVPREIAFGSLAPGTVATRKLLLKLAPDASSLHPADVTIEHNLGQALTVACREVSSRVLELSATASVPEAAEQKKLRGTIRLTFSEDSFGPVEIPVSAGAR